MTMQRIGLLLLVLLQSALSSGDINQSAVCIDFKNPKGDISKSIKIPPKSVISYELDFSLNIYSFGFFSEPNRISLPEKHANTYYVFSHLNPKTSIVEKTVDKNRVAYFRFYCLNGPFYLICDLPAGKLHLMLADAKCMEIEIKEMILPEKTVGLYFLVGNPGSYSDIDRIALGLPPLFFEYVSENIYRRISIFPESINENSLMDKLYSSVTRNIVVSNDDYEILAKILFEKKSFLALK